MADKIIIGGGLSAEELKERLDQSSGQARNLMVAFATSMLFMLAATASTTHVMIFMPDSRLSLPLVQIQVSLVGFYILAPFIFFVFHVNFLFNLQKHADKFLAWRNKAIEEKKEEIEKKNRLAKVTGKEQEPIPGNNIQIEEPSLFQFIFNYSLAHSLSSYRIGIARLIAIFMTWFIAFGGPLLTLLFIQVRFIPYHGYTITTIHRLLVIADALLLIYYWLRIRRPDWSVSGLVKRPLLKSWIPFVGSGVSFLILLGVSGVSWHEAVIPEQKGDGYEKTAEYLSIAASYPPFHTSFNMYRKWIERKEPLSSEEVRKTSKEYLTEFIRGSFPKNLDLASEIRAGKVTFENEGVDFSDRDLRYANLTGLKAAKPVFTNAQLQGAFLWEAQLQGAFLWEAQLQSADLSFAQLQGADLNNAQLQGAFLWHAQLQGAILDNAAIKGMEGLGSLKIAVESASCQWAVKTGQLGAVQKRPF